MPVVYGVLFKVKNFAQLAPVWIKLQIVQAKNYCSYHGLRTRSTKLL